MKTKYALFHSRSPAVRNSLIFGLFILLSLLAHGVFLMIDRSPSSLPTAQTEPTLQITLQQPQPKLQHKPAPPPPAQEQIAKSPSEQAKASPPASTKVAVAPARQASTVKPKTPIVNAFVMRDDALQWLQQQANKTFDKNAHIRQLVSAAQPTESGYSYNAYRASETGTVHVAFKLGSTKLCAEAREANPLISLDQSTWALSSNCRG